MAVTLSEEALAAAAELQKIRRAVSQLRRRETDARETILKELAGEERGLTASGLSAVTITLQHRRGANLRKLEAMYPEIWEAVMEESTATVVKIDLPESTEDFLVDPLDGRGWGPEA